MPKLCLEGKGMNWETALLGEVPQESEVTQSWCSGMSTFFGGVGSGQHSAELHWFRGCRVGAGQVPSLARSIVKNAAKMQIEGEPDELKCRVVLKNDVSAVESAVQEQSDSWHLLEPAFRNPQSIVDVTQAKPKQIAAHAGACDARCGAKSLLAPQ